jgi:hypothetical protein
MLIPVGERAVLAHSSNSLGYSFEIADFYWDAAGFSDIGGEIDLEFGGMLIDSVTWGGTGCTNDCSCVLNCASTTYASGGWYWRTGRAMSLNESSISGSLSDANDTASNWCEEDLALGSNGDFGSPGFATSSLGPCG